MTYIQNVIIELPDGTQGDLMTFYEATMSGEIGVSDDGFVLPDGSILPTNGEPLWDASEEEMMILMDDYIIQDNRSFDGYNFDSDKEDKSYLKLIAIGLLIYIVAK
jgi:hypothetical protein